MSMQQRGEGSQGAGGLKHSHTLCTLTRRKLHLMSQSSYLCNRDNTTFAKP